MKQLTRANLQNIQTAQATQYKKQTTESKKKKKSRAEDIYKYFSKEDIQMAKDTCKAANHH